MTAQCARLRWLRPLHLHQSACNQWLHACHAAAANKLCPLTTGPWPFDHPRRSSFRCRWTVWRLLRESLATKMVDVLERNLSLIKHHINFKTFSTSYRSPIDVQWNEKERARLLWLLEIVSYALSSGWTTRRSALPVTHCHTNPSPTSFVVTLSQVRITLMFSHTSFTSSLQHWCERRWRHGSSSVFIPPDVERKEMVVASVTERCQHASGCCVESLSSPACTVTWITCASAGTLSCVW